MVKNSNRISDIFVKKIVQKGEKVLEKKQILKIWKSSGGNPERFSYALTVLQYKNLCLRVAKDVYIVNLNGNLEELYWNIISKVVDLYSPSGAIVGGEKSLELHMMNFLSPQKLVLYTRDITARIRLFEGREVHFRVINSGEKTQRKNLFFIIKPFCSPLNQFKNILIPVSEIALLESLSLKEYNIGTNDAMIISFLDRNYRKLNFQNFHKIAQYRYIRAINRLRQIAKSRNYIQLYNTMLEVIKIEGGGVFLSL